MRRRLYITRGSKRRIRQGHGTKTQKTDEQIQLVGFSFLNFLVGVELAVPVHLIARCIESLFSYCFSCDAFEISSTVDYTNDSYQ